MIKKLREFEKEQALLEHAENLLYWDQATIMPSKALAQRADASALIAKIAHEKTTSPEFEKLITKLDKKKSLSKIDRLIVNTRLDEYTKCNKVPLDFVEKGTRATALSYEAWVKAKKENNYNLFEPHLKKQIKLAQQYAEYIGEPTYESCLDSFEPSIKPDYLDNLFSDLGDKLRSLIEKIKKSDNYKIKYFNNMKVPVDIQRTISKDILKYMGVDFERSTIADTTHPFMSTMSYDDKRIAVAYRENNFIFGITSTMHEGGHALYELGIDKKYADTCIHNAPSMGMHESQSRFWENQIGLSKEFWHFYLPKLNKIFYNYINTPPISKTELDAFYLSINTVKPSLIRIEADEVTYCLHIIIRYELERGLLEGKISTKELPELWNKKYKQYLGITPPSASKGVLQDVHWCEGLFGYFPSYALGNIFSGMFYEKMLKDIPNSINDIKFGRLNTIREWQRKNIHRHGASIKSLDLIKKVCKNELTIKPYLEYLNEKYGEIYGIK